MRCCLCALAVLWVTCAGWAGAAPTLANVGPIWTNRTTPSVLRSYFVAPTRVLWKSPFGVEHAEALLKERPPQPVLKEPAPVCVLRAAPGRAAGILLDFGRELNGSVELFTPMSSSKEPIPVRIRFGESASEAMAELGEPQNAQNDHAVRDQIVHLPWLGRVRVGPSGFRFVRIDALDPQGPVSLTQVRAILEMK